MACDILNNLEMNWKVVGIYYQIWVSKYDQGAGCDQCWAVKDSVKKILSSLVSGLRLGVFNIIMSTSWYSLIMSSTTLLFLFLLMKSPPTMISWFCCCNPVINVPMSCQYCWNKLKPPPLPVNCLAC
jgi:hypothetical protein